MKKLLYLSLILTFGFSSNINAQEIIKKTLCLNVDEIYPNGYNIFEGDQPCENDLPFFLTTSDSCYYVQQGLLYLTSSETCCDTFLIEYLCEDPSGIRYELTLIIKCDDPVPKPNCTHINLSDIETDIPGGDPNSKVTLYACDSSLVTYYVNEAPGQTIIWDAGIAVV